MHEFVLLEILASPAERSRGRHNPRVVERKMSGFPTEARAAPGPPPSRRFHYRDHVRIVAPATAAAEPAMAAPKRPRPCEARTERRAFRLEHVRAWRASGPSRAGYAERHGLKLPALHQWIARLRHTFRKRGKAHANPA